MKLRSTNLDVAYHKVLDYEKYLRVIPRRVQFNPVLIQVALAHFLDLTLVPNLSTMHHHQGLLLVPLPLD